MTYKKNINKDFISQFLAIMGSTVINVLISFFLTPLITRFVDPEEYGKLSMFNLYGNIGLMVFCMGLDQAMIRFFYACRDDREQRSLVRFCFVVPTIATIIVSMIYYVLIVLHVVEFEFGWLASMVLPGYVFLNIWSRLASMVLRVSYESKKYAFCNIIGRGVYALLVVLTLCVVGIKSFNGLMICTVFTSAIGVIAATWYGKAYWKWKDILEVRNKKEILKYSFPFVLSMSITTVLEAADKFALQSFCTYSELGVYQSALSVVGVFALVQSSFNTLWTPIQTEQFVKNQGDVSLIQKGNQYITVIMFIFGINILLFKDVVVLLLGEKYRDASSILPFLILHPIMYTISETTCSGIDKSQKTILHVIVAFAAGIFNVIGNWILVPILGPRGAAISTGLSYVIFFIVRTVFSNKFYYIDYKLKKLAIVTTMTVAFAAICTFYHFNFLYILAYVMCMSSVFLLYRKQVKECCTLGINYMKTRIYRRF